MPAAPEAVDGAVSRPSRQDLVVPPRASSWPIAVGVVASAAAGFGLVFFLGIGRNRTGSEGLAPAATDVAMQEDATAAHATALDAAADEPALLPPAVPTGVSPTDRWSPRTGSDGASAEPSGERYATRPAAHLEPPPPEPAAETAGRRMSRFSSPDLPPAQAAAEGPQASPPPGDIEAAADQPPAIEADAEPAATATTLEPPPATAGRAASPTDLPAPLNTDLAAIPEAGATEPVASEPVATEPAKTEPVATEPAATAPAAPAAATPEPEPAPANPAGAPAPFTPPAPPPAAAPAAEQEPATAVSPPPTSDPSPAPPAPLDAAEPRALPFGPPPAAAPAPPPPTAATPPAAAIPAGLPTPPFAAAPPIGPPRPLQPAAPVDAPPPAGEPAEPAAPPAVEGQGVPGPLQLEGVQAPQLTVEKRGPKEIQVGQPARFEILVRNVGSATAHEVTLRDEVPRGTSLIATTPPATPAEGGATAELVWALGVLPPGGESRVLMELMPETEGEVGSVASVSFRADATLRARATKPALAIDCRPPEPVRIGGDVEVTLTVSNPGSGTATGVVLEAFLPETVSHRAGDELEFDVGQLRPGESKTIDLVLGTRTPGQAPARFVARADGGIEVDQPLPLPVTAPTLEITIDMPARRFLQRPATCTISMVNAGTASARAVELAAQLPAGMKFVRANNAGWHDERTHRVLWNLEELPPGETGTVEVVVMPVQPGGQRITAAARSTDGPSDQALHVCQVEGLAALAFHVADSEDPIEVEGVTEYVIRVANEGTKAASGVRLAATLLGELEPVEAEGPGKHRVENLAIEFEPLAKLGPGEEAVYKIRARGRRAGHQRVQVQLISDDQPTPITKEEVTSVYDDR